VSLKEATLRAAVIKRLQEKISEVDKAGRVDGLEQFIAAQDALGVKTVDVTLPDGTKVARATLPSPQPGIRVDEAAFIAWVRDQRPDEIVDAVRESFRRAVLKDLVINDGEVVNKRTGESVDWAYVRPAADRPSSFSVTFVGEGRDLIEQAWRNGDLNILDIIVPPALPAGGEDGDASPDAA
jgi:hypothetical protein